MRWSWITFGVAAACLCGTRAAAQGRNFAGTWELRSGSVELIEPLSRTLLDLGQMMTVTMDGRIMVLSQWVGSAGRQWTVRLDGSESSFDSNTIATSQWQGDTLVVNTRRAAGNDDPGTLKFHIDAGELVLEASSFASPSPYQAHFKPWTESPAPAAQGLGLAGSWYFDLPRNAPTAQNFMGDLVITVTDRTVAISQGSGGQTVTGMTIALNGSPMPGELLGIWMNGRLTIGGTDSSPPRAVMYIEGNDLVVEATAPFGDQRPMREYLTRAPFDQQRQPIAEFMRSARIEDPTRRLQALERALIDLTSWSSNTGGPPINRQALLDAGRLSKEADRLDAVQRALAQMFQLTLPPTRRPSVRHLEGRQFTGRWIPDRARNSPPVMSAIELTIMLDSNAIAIMQTLSGRASPEGPLLFYLDGRQSRNSSGDVITTKWEDDALVIRTMYAGRGIGSTMRVYLEGGDLVMAGVNGSAEPFYYKRIGAQGVSEQQRSSR